MSGEVEQLECADCGGRVFRVFDAGERLTLSCAQCPEAKPRRDAEVENESSTRARPPGRSRLRVWK